MCQLTGWEALSIAVPPEPSCSRHRSDCSGIIPMAEVLDRQSPPDRYKVGNISLWFPLRLAVENATFEACTERTRPIHAALFIEYGLQLVTCGLLDRAPVCVPALRDAYSVYGSVCMLQEVVTAKNRSDRLIPFCGLWGHSLGPKSRDQSRSR